MGVKLPENRSAIEYIDQHVDELGFWSMDALEAAHRWASTWVAAWSAHDVEAVVALYAEDCVHRSTPFRSPHVGRDGVRAYVREAFAEEQQVDEVRFGAPVVEGDRACVEYWTRFHDRRGAPMTLAGCGIARFDPDGLVVEVQDYWHLREGHEEPPDGWGGARAGA